MSRHFQRMVPHDWVLKDDKLALILACADHNLEWKWVTIQEQRKMNFNIYHIQEIPITNSETTNNSDNVFLMLSMQRYPVELPKRQYNYGLLFVILMY